MKMRTKDAFPKCTDVKVNFLSSIVNLLIFYHAFFFQGKIHILLIG